MAQNAQSAEALQDAKANKENNGNRIVALIAEHGSYGMTCDEIEEHMGLSHQTASARCSELLESKRIKRQEKDGKRVTRKTRSGSSAAVLVLNSEDSRDDFLTRKEKQRIAKRQKEHMNPILPGLL